MSSKLKIGIVGAGRIAYSLTPALIKAGYEIVIISSAKLVSAKKLAKNNGIKLYSDNLIDVISRCNLIFIAVPDSQIEITANDIAKLQVIKEKVFVHLSGTKNIKALHALSKKGANVAGLHLLQAFPERKPVNFEHCYASVEASNKKTGLMLTKLAKNIGTVPFSITGDEKILLHIMCVFTANFINADFYNALLLYKKIKSKLPPMEKLLYPLSSSNLINIRDKGVIKSLSGPLARRDYDTVNEHLEKLFSIGKKDKDFSNVLESYAIQTLNLLMLSGKTKNKNRKNPTVR